MAVPGEFSGFFFDDVAGGIGAAYTSEEVRKVVKQVCIKNGLYSAIEMMSVKFPFGSGIAAGATAAANPAVPNSVSKGINAYKQIPDNVTRKVVDELIDYLRLWAVNAPRAHDQVQGLNFEPEDARIVANMAPEGRMEMVMAAAENHYAIQYRLAAGKFPIAALFDPAMESGVKGKYSTSIGLAGRN